MHKKQESPICIDNAITNENEFNSISCNGENLASDDPISESEFCFVSFVTSFEFAIDNNSKSLFFVKIHNILLFYSASRNQCWKPRNIQNLTKLDT